MKKAIACFLVLHCAACSAPSQPPRLPAVPVPAENPVTEAKRVLGKILFWDEQLSGDSTVACGTCHIPSRGGADPRSGINPGSQAGTVDDVFGSPGIARLDRDGEPVDDPVFGTGPQVTERFAPSIFGALWANAVFWDGRAGPGFVDPLTGRAVIESGGALESQVLETLANPAEMARVGQTWGDLMEKLASARPLALASHLPEDVRAALRESPGYPQLFRSAFGDGEITPVRIAFAIASYERTLVADDTPWDRFQAGDTGAMGIAEQSGWRSFRDFHCDACHVPPLFTGNEFFNIGLRRVEYDPGRQDVTGDPEDAGEVKVPSLRNVGLRARFMHTGEFATLNAALRFYVNTVPFEHRDEIPGIGAYSFNFDLITQGNIRAFLANALTDPRVRDEEYPFDRPTLHSERAAD